MGQRGEQGREGGQREPRRTEIRPLEGEDGEGVGIYLKSDNFYVSLFEDSGRGDGEGGLSFT